MQQTDAAQAASPKPTPGQAGGTRDPRDQPDHMCGDRTGEAKRQEQPRCTAVPARTPLARTEKCPPSGEGTSSRPRSQAGPDLLPQEGVGHRFQAKAQAAGGLPLSWNRELPQGRAPAGPRRVGDARRRAQLCKLSHPTRRSQPPPSGRACSRISRAPSLPRS